jgi:1-acyl-sn-glycerol-3-phosphate acyltransferase
MIKTILVVCWTIFATIIFGLTAAITAFFSKTGNVPHKVAILWARTILFVSRVRVKTEGGHRLIPKKSYIFMANHQSNFDILALFAGLPVQFRWLAKAELFKIPIFAQGMRGCGYISIDRSNQESAFLSLHEAAEKIKSGVSVMIFPEGTRSHDGELLPFKKGGFVLAKDAGVPIVPVVIKGSRFIMAKKKMRIKAGEIRLEILPEIDTLAFAEKDKNELMEAVRLALSAALKNSEGA